MLACNFLTVIISFNGCVLQHTDKKHHKLWVEIVPIRLGDLYRGMELGASLTIIKELNNGCELEVAKVIIEEQGHSGMSFGLVCSMIQGLCDRGIEFTNYVRADF